MENFALILVCLVAGWLLRRAGHFTESAPKALNAFVVWLSLPALVLTQVPPLLANPSFDRDVLVPIATPWIGFLLATAGVVAIGKVVGFSVKTEGALALTVGLGNTSFVGYPLVESLLGKDALKYAVLVDQPGSFLVLSTLAMIVGAKFAARSRSRSANAPSPDGETEGEAEVHSPFRRVLGFPPFVALVVAVVLGFVRWPMPGALVAVLDKLTATLVPLALVTVGAQIRIHGAVLREHRVALLVGLGLKLVLIPASFVVVYVYGLALRGTAVHVTLLQVAMAPMITSVVLVTELGLDEELAGLMCGVGIPLSLVTVPLWNVLLARVV